MKKIITQSELLDLLKYDSETGLFHWTKRRHKVTVGSQAGTLNKKGYIVIMINRKPYFAHRLAWLYTEGYCSEYEIDHIDRNRSNNARSNLRETSRSCNARNGGIRKNNNTGVNGVNKYKDKWTARIGVLNKKISLGNYDNFDDAVMARWEAEKEHGFENCLVSSTAFLYLKNNNLI